MKTFAAVICSLLVMSAPFAWGGEVAQITQLRWVERSDPIADSEAAIQRKDHVLLAVQGYTWTIPGVEDSKKFEYKKRFGLRVLEGTSDSVVNSEHLRLIRLATEYAANYNRHLLKRLNTLPNVR